VRGVTVRPDFLDRFPRTRRGHGTTHPHPTVRHGKTNSGKVRKACPCVQSSCELNMRKGGETHSAHDSNVDDWREEHGITTDRQRQAARKERMAHQPKKYIPAPARVVEAPYTRSERCSCGHKPSGMQGDEALELGVCVSCWKRGYAKKYRHADESGAVAA
jgi:hypothetical protein